MIFVYILYQLCKYGRGFFSGEIIILTVCGLALFIWFIISIIFAYQKKEIMTISNGVNLRKLIPFFLVGKQDYKLLSPFSISFYKKRA